MTRTSIRLAAIALSAAAVMGGTASSAHAEGGSVTVPGPGGCDFKVWWDTTADPMAGATVPHYNSCVKAVSDLFGTG